MTFQSRETHTLSLTFCLLGLKVGNLEIWTGVFGGVECVGCGRELILGKDVLK
jgi:hypothetical protein